MKKLLFFMLFAMLTSMAMGQSDIEPIETFEKGLFKKKYYKKCGVEMNQQQLVMHFKDNPEMKAYYKPMALNFLASQLLGITAGALIAIPVAQGLDSDGDPNWNLAYIGAGCALLAIPFNKWFDKNAQKAIQYYNTGYGKDSGYIFKLNIGTNGIGVALKF
ncbi:hypothetical protein V6R21_06220 [Limibacter armeniacum]|uniref:hypothetical protein n=1 Tax=Limibacter armeniacum TaxID=466084 RepID=UPI002FE64156